MKLESYTRIDERAKIQGVALIPRISRNNNLYTKEELKRFDNVTVPLNWEHDPGKQIGTATFHYNPSIETVYYEGEISDEGAASLARNKTLFTSIEAEPVKMQEICNGPNDCFSMPFGLVPQGLALTETPGVPETTVGVIEHYIEECSNPEYHKYEKGQKFEQAPADPDCVSKKISKLDDEKPDMPHDQKVSIAHDMCRRKETLAALESLGVLEALDLVYCEDCGKVKKNENK